jgi:hypothetical protein
MLQVPVILAIGAPHQTTGDNDREPPCSGPNNASGAARRMPAPWLSRRVYSEPASLTRRMRIVG